MSSIKLSELMGKHIKKVFSGSELLYIYELNKYTKELLGADLDVEDIQMVKELRKGDYFSYVYSKGMNFNYIPIESELSDITEVSRRFFNSDLSGVVFETQTDDTWLYNYKTNTKANLVLNQYNRSAGYVSLYAYMVVNAYKMGKKVPLLVLENSSPKQEEFEYVDILILKNFGNCFLKDKVEVIFSKEVVIQPEWEAYIMYHRQLGLMLSEVKATDKFKYMTKNFEYGDVVLYYETDKAIKSKSIRRLMNCYPAVIKSVTKTGVSLEYYPDISTELTKKRELQKAEEICGGEYKYSHEDYNRFPRCSINLDYFNFGVDTLFYTEDRYLLTPQNGTDSFKQYITNKDGIEGVYDMDTLNTIYAVFEDRHIRYNKEGFLNKYFKKEKPLYDIIKGR